MGFQVETVGQIYMAVSGAPERSTNHVENIVTLALEMIRQVGGMKGSDGAKVDIRIGRSGFTYKAIFFKLGFRNPFRSGCGRSGWD